MYIPHATAAVQEILWSDTRCQFRWSDNPSSFIH